MPCCLPADHYKVDHREVDYYKADHHEADHHEADHNAAGALSRCTRSNDEYGTSLNLQ